MQASRRLQALFAMTGLLLSACASLPDLPGLPPGEDQAMDREQTGTPRPADRADALRDELARIDALPVPQRQQGQLRLAQRLIGERRLDEARKLLQRTFVFNLAPEFKWRKTLVQAGLALAEDRPVSALDLLRTPPPAAPDNLLARWFELRAQARYAQGAWLDSLRERILRAGYLDDPLDRRDNQQLIWQTLQHAAGVAPTVQAGETELQGWLELYRLWQENRRFLTSGQPALDEWRARYPDHPADPERIRFWFGSNEYRLDPQRPVTLLLPLSGPHAQAAAAIREGLLAAYFQAMRTAPQPPLYILDSTEDVLAGYHRAVTMDAQLVIGPLRKEAVNLLARQAELPVPVLALNHLEPRQAPDTGMTAPPATDGAAPLMTAPGTTGMTRALYQFGLNPEQEIEQISARAFREGCRAPLALVPGNDWGERMAAALDLAWQSGDGRLLLVQRYNARGNDFSHAIKSLLDIDDSERRKRALEATLGTRVGFEPRRRRDADCIILAARPRQARLIRPQLRFHYAADLPVYATSHAYSGHLDPAADRDMNGLRIVASPWVLAAAEAGSGLLPARDREARDRLGELWPDDSRTLTRLHALGVDAYHLAPLLDTLRRRPETRYRGATGTLGIDAAGRVQRELVWADFIRGVPRIVELPEPTTAFQGPAPPDPGDARQ